MTALDPISQIFTVAAPVVPAEDQHFTAKQSIVSLLRACIPCAQPPKPLPKIRVKPLVVTFRMASLPFIAGLPYTMDYVQEQKKMIQSEQEYLQKIK